MEYSAGIIADSWDDIFRNAFQEHLKLPSYKIISTIFSLSPTDTDAYSVYHSDGLSNNTYWVGAFLLDTNTYLGVYVRMVPGSEWEEDEYHPTGLWEVRAANYTNTDSWTKLVTWIQAYRLSYKLTTKLIDSCISEYKTELEAAFALRVLGEDKPPDDFDD
jgi:hypothetical protein